MISHTIRAACIGALCAAAVVAARAQPLTLPDVLAHVAASDPAIVAQRAELRRAEEGRAIAVAALLPQVDFSMQQGKASRRQLPQPGPLSANDGQARPSGSRSLTVSQLLFDGGRSRANVAVSAADLDRQRVLLRKVVDERLLAALQAWHALGGARQREGVAVAVDQRLGQLVGLVDRRVQAGQAPLVELRRAQSRLLEQGRTLAEARGQLQAAQARFANLTGLDASRAAFDSGPAEALAPAGASRELCSTACLEVLEAEAIRLRAEQELARAAGGFAPRVSLQAAVGRHHNPSGASDHYQDRSLALVASWNLYAGGADTGRRREALEALEAARSREDSARRAALDSFDLATQEERTALAVEQLAVQAVAVGTETRRLAQLGYEAGQRPLLDVADALVEEARHQNSLSDAQERRAVARYRRLALSGDLAPSFGMAGQGPP